MAVGDVQPGDAVVYVDTHNGGLYTRFVKSVAKKTVTVEQPKPITPKTKRINRTNIKECWRWHKKT